MTQNKKIVETVLDVIEEINLDLPEDSKLERSIHAVLFGDAGPLSSLELVMLVIAIEERIEEEFDVTLTLADERAVSQKNSPFHTVETLVDYIVLLLKEHAHG